MKPILLCLLPFALGITGCTGKPNDFLPGYAEADYVRVSSTVGGKLTKLYVTRGGKLDAGAPVFVLENENERAARAEAVARVDRAQAQLANLQKGKRPDEIAAVKAQLAQAQAALRLTSADFTRQSKLVADKFISASRLDEARAAMMRDQERVKELQAQLRIAQQGARSDEIAAARKDVQAAQAQLAQAEWKLEQTSVRSPVAAEVVDVLYREGEWVPAGSPVASLLPPQNIKARFFVPETMLGAIRLGQAVQLRCDGCDAPTQATVSFIAREAEYTAPLIYSRENRSSLVFMIEAKPAADKAIRLHPGQPLEIDLRSLRSAQ